MVRLTPRAGVDRVEGWASDEKGRSILKIKVAAAPVDGAANAALTALLAKALRVPKSAVRLLAGETARIKRLEIAGLTDADLSAALGGPP